MAGFVRAFDVEGGGKPGMGPGGETITGSKEILVCSDMSTSLRCDVWSWERATVGRESQ